MCLEEKNFGQFLDIRAPVSGTGFEPKRTVHLSCERAVGYYPSVPTTPLTGMLTLMMAVIVVMMIIGMRLKYLRTSSGAASCPLHLL